jgi:ATP-dependent HslUV protease subunit HslV
MENEMTAWRGTTILSVRKGNEVVVAGDGQVTMGSLVLKSNVRKVRRVGKGDVIAGFAGSTADALALFERLEVKLDQNPHQLVRACVDLAKDWRRDRYLRRLEAMMAVVSPLHSLILTGTGDVLEPEDGLIGIGSGGPYALSAARALIDIEGLTASMIAEKAMNVAAGLCVYTNNNVVIESIEGQTS